MKSNGQAVELPKRYKYRYEYFVKGADYLTHQYILRCSVRRHNLGTWDKPDIVDLTEDRGAIHFWVTDNGFADEHRLDRFYGGIESHYTRWSRPEYFEAKDPTNDPCDVLGGGQPCWHDGSSLYAEENLIPLWRAVYNIPHEGSPAGIQEMFRHLVGDADASLFGKYEVEEFEETHSRTMKQHRENRAAEIARALDLRDGVRPAVIEPSQNLPKQSGQGIQPNG